jgi:AcrR family transcriptional regulator
MSSKGERTRRKILDVALRQLRSQGPARVRMEDVARAAGISRQALYLHFASRTQLMVALIEHLSEVADGAALFRRAEEKADVGERMEEGLKASTRLIARIHDVALALDVARHSDDSAAAAWDARGKLRRDGIRRTIALAARAGRLRKGWTVDQVADALWSLAAPRLYGDLVLERGWSRARLERLMVALARTFIEPRAPRARRSS